MIEGQQFEYLGFTLTPAIRNAIMRRVSIYICYLLVLFAPFLLFIFYYCDIANVQCPMIGLFARPYSLLISTYFVLLFHIAFLRFYGETKICI